MPAADFCHTVRKDRSSLSPDSRTCGRPPVIRTTAFNAQPPNLPPAPSMVVGFAVSCQFARRRRPHIRFLFIGSRLCSTLPSDPTSRRRPCASLALRRHQAGQRTSTSKLPSMLGTRKYPPAKPGALRLGPLKGDHFPTFDDVPRIQARYLHRDGTLDRAVGIVAPTARNPT